MDHRPPAYQRKDDAYDESRPHEVADRKRNLQDAEIKIQWLSFRAQVWPWQPTPRQYHGISLHAGVSDGTGRTTVLSALPEGLETTGAQEVYVGGDALDLFPRHPQQLGNPVPFAVGP